ncbi:MAG: DUF885 family protein [Pseudomonadota bacterium]
MRRFGVTALLWATLLSVGSVHAESIPGMPSGTGDYDDLVALYDEFLNWEDEARARRAVPNRDIAGAATDVNPDYGAAAIATREEKIAAFQDRLADMAVVDFTLAQQVDYLAVRSRLDQAEFMLRVAKPWARDPGFYVDRMLRLTFTRLPLDEKAALAFQAELRAVALLIDAAQKNLTDVAADYADLAIYNLSNADGVGHGYPYRAVPPAGVLGWYDDLLARASAEQPNLVPEIQATRDAVTAFSDWLVDKRPSMTGQAGVGKAHFDWYLKHVKLMPWDTDDMVTLGLRELDRLWAVYGLAQHKNRELPPIELPATAAEYAERINRVDTMIREFLGDEEIISVPGFIGTLGTNVPWIERPDGPNFWEQVQFRDPTPDHLHAVIPGHRFDGVMERVNRHPIRGRFTSGARTEGWAVYLEEAMLEAGLDVAPRVRELIYIFGIFRAARVPADVWLQLNEMDVDEAVAWWLERVPYLDKNVARVDAEIYLRRPPGYGLGYTIGMLQMQRLLAERKRQLGDAFVLKNFHDTFMAAGRLPIALIHWEMTGQTDTVEKLWPRVRLADVQ